MAGLVSLVVPVYNEEEVLPLLRDALARSPIASRRTRARRRDRPGGRRQHGPELGADPRVRQHDPRVRAMSLTRNFGHQAALTCGYQLARGDAVVTLDADLQDPPAVALALIDAWRDGADIVYAVREQRDGEGRFKRWSADSSTACSGAHRRHHRTARRRRLPPDEPAGGRRPQQLHEVHRYIRGMVGWLGYRTAIVQYHRRRARRAGRSTRFFRMLRLAVSAIVSFSTFPLQPLLLARHAEHDPFRGVRPWSPSTSGTPRTSPCRAAGWRCRCRSSPSAA